MSLWQLQQTTARFFLLLIVSRIRIPEDDMAYIYYNMEYRITKLEDILFRTMVDDEKNKKHDV